MAKTNTPVSSFGPEIMALLRKGSEESFTIDLPDAKSAFRLMSRINSLRAAMRREKHPDSDRVYRAGVRISRDNKCRLIIAPRDSEFGELLLRANLIPLPPSTSEAPTPLPGTAEDSADSFLASLGKNSVPNSKKSDEKDEK